MSIKNCFQSTVSRLTVVALICITCAVSGCSEDTAAPAPAGGDTTGSESAAPESGGSDSAGGEAAGSENK